MFRLKTVQPCGTSDMLTRVKMIICGRMLNTLSISILYDNQGHRKTLILISWVESLLEPIRDPPQHPNLGLQDPTPSTITSIPSRNHLLEHQHFTMRHSTMLDLSLHTLRAPIQRRGP